MLKVLFITPGSGDAYYCGNCFRDNLQAQALQRAGHDVVMMPLYLPLKHIGPLQGDAPLLFPATTYYVEQLLSGRKLPNWLKRLLSSEKALSLASSMAGTTSAKGMEDMTLSMISGEGKAFKENVKQLVIYLKDIEQPNIIHLSSSLLLGIAKELKKETNIPIVCSLQDEEVWIDSLKDEAVSHTWQAVIDKAKYVDGFITTSQYYKRVVNERLPQLGNVKVVYPGVNIDQYKTDVLPDDPTIGFFYRMNELDGLDILAEAFVLLKKRNAIPNLKFRIGGGYTSTDKKFLAQIKKTISPYADDVTLEEEYSWERHADFYRKITVLSVPLRFQEGVGLYLCEAFAAGRPAVEPNTGSFAEILGDAGLIYEPNDPEHLADALERILTDKQLYAQCRKQALILVKERYEDLTMVKQLVELYNELQM